MIQTENNTPTMLVILDGFGYRADKKGNALACARMPMWNFLVEHYPHILLAASGRAVGLPDGFMGNSEVGHLTIGAGRVIKTVLCKLHEAIADGSFFVNPMLVKHFRALAQAGKSLHLMGLLSDAGVHSHQQHLYAFLKLAKKMGVARTYIHAFLDGRDTPPCSAGNYLDQLQAFCCAQNYGEIASIHGRFYAMDRDNNWDRTKKSYDVISGNCFAVNTAWQNVLGGAYARGEFDEFVPPTLLISDGSIKNGDGIVFFNFRPDRARQLTQTFINPAFQHFIVEKRSSFFISPVRFKDEFAQWDNNDVLFSEEKIEGTLLDQIEKQASGRSIFIIAETEKYAHVTYFFRGMRDEQKAFEIRILVPSIKAKNYIQHPQMAAPQITEKIIESLNNDAAFFYLVNYANGDMVGHSGNFEATIKACECIDQQLKKLYDVVVKQMHGTIFITGDHGNVEEKLDEVVGGVKTSHTTNPVPFIIINESIGGRYAQDFAGLSEGVGLANIAATILDFLKLKTSSNMAEKIDF